MRDFSDSTSLTILLRYDRIVKMIKKEEIMKLIDLTHLLNRRTPHYPGDSPLELKEVVFDHITVSEIASSLHSGTHLDVPRHMMLKDAKKVCDYAIQAFMGKAWVFHLNEHFKMTQLDCVKEGDVVLLRTDYCDRYYHRDYYEQYPALDDVLIDGLIDKKIKLLGLDTPSPDYAPYLNHQKLFKENIPIVENLTNLKQLPLNKSFMFYAVPLKIAAEGSFVRAFAVLEEGEI